MIRVFQISDPRRLKSNRWSSTRGLTKDIFGNDQFFKQTVVDDDGEVMAIIAFAPYEGRNFVAMFFIAQDIGIAQVRELKKFIEQAREDFHADRIQTDSPACDSLDQWHKFLGFTLEGRRNRMCKGKDYHLWGMLKGRDF